MILLKHCFYETDEKSYANVARKYYNEGLGKFVEFCQLFYCITTCCAYTILIANQLSIIMSYINDSYPFPSKIHFLLGIVLLYE